MNISQWLDAETGRNASLAAFFNVTPGAVSQWRTTGVPPKHMKAVRDFTGGDVSLEEMLPDCKGSKEKADFKV